MPDDMDISPQGFSEGEIMGVFHSDVVDRVRGGSEPNVWRLPGGALVLPRVFGFCRGVKRALALAERAADEHARLARTGLLILLGEIIHNPWVNAHFQRRGVRILTRSERQKVEEHVTRDDVAIVPAFGVPLPIERRLRDIGCRIVDCTCGDVRRLWTWSEQAARDGYGVIVFGRSEHDETVVTKSRLAEAGGTYLVLETLRQVEQFGGMFQAEANDADFRASFSPAATNAASLKAFETLAQVSQTTMLYNHTRRVREILTSAFETRFGSAAADRLRFQPTVCRATQDRQDAAVELCRSGCGLVIVVGGFGSSNTRHLHELARQYAPAYLIENADAIRSVDELLAYDRDGETARTVHSWLPKERPLRVGLLAGASSPEIVIGRVLERLAEFLR
ncbi:MAG: 4-hydroxy-3-methylbut-2-enyl diphosphate reductase [Phycisphaerae bacterium]|nr:4-hydroxy-3-methylbut-2-enyl diphosphate reductase [Phycisphaerae bacterium]